MTRIAWACLLAGLVACGVALWNRTQADKARRAAEEAIALAERAVANLAVAGAVAETERQARVFCQAKGQQPAALRILYADGIPARVAVICTNELKS